MAGSSGPDPVVPPSPTAVPSGYPRQLEQDVVLSDGGTVRVRPLVPDDGAALRALFQRMSRESRYYRFFSPKERLSDDEVEYFSVVDYDRRMAIGAVLGGELLAVARYDVVGSDGDGRRAEVAFEVDDRHQGRGIGTVLLEYLAEAARERGIGHFEASVLPDNRRMLGVFRDAGWQVRNTFADGVMEVRFPIEATSDLLARMDDRERRAQARSIARVLRPASVALLGASERRGSIGRYLLENLTRSAFAGPVYLVNPNHDVLGGRICWPTIGDVPHEVDLAVIAVRAELVPDLARQCAAKGVSGLVVISAGFGETGPAGAALEAELLEVVRTHGMRMVGPNSIGVINTGVGLDASFIPSPPLAGRVAFQSQSGGLGVALLDWSSRLGIGISSFVSVGNKADVSGNDLLQYWEADDSTDVVLLYLESFGNPRKFARIARRVAMRKPVVAVKAGRSPAGSRAARSHTAAAAAADDVVSALFSQAGVIRVDTVEELFDLAQVLASQPLPRGDRVAIMGNSGGPGILAADACDGAGLDVTRLSAGTATQLRELLGPNAAVGNPVDMAASATAEQYEVALRLLLDDPATDAVIVIYTPPMATAIDEVAEAVARGAEGQTKPVLVNFLGSRDVPPALRASGPRRRIPSFVSPEPAARALASAAWYEQWRTRDRGTVPAFADVDRDAAAALLRRVLDAAPQGRWLHLDEAAALLDAYGIAFVPTERADDEGAAVAAAGRLGYPVALKAGQGGLDHRPEQGAVAVDLGDAGAVARAWQRLAPRADDPGGLVVQPMVRGGVETITGVVQDPSFGPLVMVGIGGLATELLADRALHILPLTPADAHDLVRSLRASPLLFGYRGATPVRVDQLEDLLVRLGTLAVEHPEVVGLDLNPVVVDGRRAIALDARVRVEPYAAGRPDLLRSLG